ncbi:MAG: hypothetical protein ACFE8N_05545 [Promethearchaeota archaeon]
MGKSGAILGIIGLILGIGAVSLGGYAWLTLSSVENQVSNLSVNWYRNNESNLNCIPAFSYITFHGLTIEFTLGVGDSIYFNFVAMAHLEPDTGWSQVSAYFRVDGITNTSHYVTVGLYNGQTASLVIALQHKRYDLSPGIHTVTVVIVGTKTGNYIYHSSLFVQKFLM